MRISDVTVVIDGEEINDFSQFQEDARELATTVDTVKGADTIKLPPKYGFQLSFLPKSGGDRVWDGVSNATVIVQYVGGTKVTFIGCEVLTITPNAIDGKSGKENVIAFSAASRKES